MRYALLLLFCVVYRACSAEEIVLDGTASRDRVWAKGMPEQRHIGDLEQWLIQDDDWEAYYQNSAVLKINKALLSQWSPGGQLKAGNVLLVPGEGPEALRHVLAHLVHGKPLVQAVAGRPTSIFFYAHANGQASAKLTSVEIVDKTISLRYRSVFQDRGDGGPQFALISTPQLDAGDYKIELIGQGAERTDPLSAGEVCQSATHTVVDLSTVRSIPLDEIWGHEFSGTKSLQKLDPLAAIPSGWGKPATGSPFWSMEQAVLSLDNDQIGETFVVCGSPEEALEEASRVLRDLTPRRTTAPHDTPLYVVFYAREGAQYVSLKSVEDRGNVIEINFRKIEHDTMDFTTHVALIPIGTKRVGEVSIDVRALPTLSRGGQIPQRKNAQSSAHRGVSTPSAFRISQEE